eukprot:6315213-Amphidinium_carterae.1
MKNKDMTQRTPEVRGFGVLLWDTSLPMSNSKHTKLQLDRAFLLNLSLSGQPPIPVIFVILHQVHASLSQRWKLVVYASDLPDSVGSRYSLLEKTNTQDRIKAAF